MRTVYTLPLMCTPAPEGGYTVSSPVLPGLVTEGNMIEEVVANARDAFQASVESYEADGLPLPVGVEQHAADHVLPLDIAVSQR